MESVKMNDVSSVTCQYVGKPGVESVFVDGRYTMTCFDSQGNMKWQEEFDNIVTAEGKKHLLDHGLAGAASAVTSRMLLITSGSPVAGDTYATHAGFVEFGNIAARGTPSWSAATGADAVSKSTSANVSFSINAGTSVNVTGCGIVLVVGTVGNLGVVSDTATSNAKLYSAGAFTTGGTKVVSNGDTLTVGYTANINAG
jgi:hypothetical protein